VAGGAEGVSTIQQKQGKDDTSPKTEEQDRIQREATQKEKGNYA